MRAKRKKVREKRKVDTMEGQRAQYRTGSLGLLVAQAHFHAPFHPSPRREVPTQKE